MKKLIQIKVEEYIYKFYQKGANSLGRTPEELMEQALFLYAGMVAEELLQKEEEGLKS